jgi:microcystin-dependent protein
MSTPAPQYYQTNYTFSGGVSHTPPSTSDLGLSLVPIGTLLLYGGIVLPTNYLWCDGSSYSTTTYATLFSVIEYTYGGLGSSFNVPNMSNSVPIGASTHSNMTITYQGNSVKSGGNSFLNVSQLAQHTHNVPNGNSFVVDGDKSYYDHAMSTSSTNLYYKNTDLTATGNISSYTSQQEFLPPFTVVNYIIKYQ